MAITAINGPHVVFGITLTSSGGTAEYNEERGPSLYDMGVGLLDPRPQFTYTPGNGVGHSIYGWYVDGPLIDATPTTVNTSGIALTQTATGSGALTLATSANSSNVASYSLTPSTGTAAVTVLAIDSALTGKSFGTGATVNIWDPSKAISRCLKVGFNSSVDYVSSGTITFAGYDLYGFALTATVSPSSTTTGTTTKAFKYLSSVTLGGITWTSTTVYVGVTDTYGLPIRVDHPGYVTAWSGASSLATLGTVAGSLTPASTVATATSTTGDVRGLWASSLASNSTAAAPVKFVLWASPSVANLATITSTNFSGLLGYNQA